MPFGQKSTAGRDEFNRGVDSFARDAQAKPLENCKVYYQNVNKCERSERNTRVNSTNLTDQVLISRVFFFIFGDFRNFENLLNGAESREELQHAKTKDKALRAPSLKESRVSSAQSSVKFQCALNFCLAILENQRQENAIEALSKKVERNGNRGWATLKSFWS